MSESPVPFTASVTSWHNIPEDFKAFLSARDALQNCRAILVEQLAKIDKQLAEIDMEITERWKPKNTA